MHYAPGVGFDGLRVQQVRSSGESFQGSDAGLDCGVSVACLAHPECELEDLAEDVGFDFLDMSDSATGGGAQSAGGGIRTHEGPHA